MTDIEKCDCGKDAAWIYMPAREDENPFYCDDCVPRGCMCNHRYVRYQAQPEFAENPPEDTKKFKWLDEEHNKWTLVDEMGREFPCIEFDPIGEND